MGTPINLFLLALSFCFIFSSCDETPPDPVGTPVTEDALDEVVLDEMARQNIQGMAVSIIRNGRIVLTKAYGHLDLERTKPVTTSTVFHWASISKTVTAVAAMRAVTDGHMELGDEVDDHVSYWPWWGYKGLITIDDLLSHRGGIVHYGKDNTRTVICDPNKEAYTANNNFNARQSVAVFKNCPVFAAPNEVYCYTTYGYNLLGAAVEEATNTPYVDYVQDKIADVAGMTSFTPYSDGQGGFLLDCNREIRDTHEGDTEYKLPGGGWASNIHDLAKFTNGLINNDFIPNTSALWVEVPGNDEYRKGVFFEFEDSNLHVNHGGDNNSVTTYMGFFPGDRNGVCFLTNANGYISKYELAKRIENLMGYTWSTNPVPLDFCGTYDKCGSKMTALWRNTDNANETLLRRNLKREEFLAEWKFLYDAGYHLVDIETHHDRDDRKWDGIFKKGNPGNALWRGFTHDNWLGKFQEMVDEGYRLVDLETYMDEGVRKWAGVFVSGSDRYAMHLGLSPEEFDDKHAELNDQGYRLIDVETYSYFNIRKWNGVWKGEGTTLLTRDFSGEEFEDLRKEREEDGYKLVDIETYTELDGTRKWAGVWESANEDEHFQMDRYMCELIRQFHKDNKRDGFELLDLEKY